MRSPHTKTRECPHVLQLEKTHTQQDPAQLNNNNNNKIKNKKEEISAYNEYFIHSFN